MKKNYTWCLGVVLPLALLVCGSVPESGLAQDLDLSIGAPLAGYSGVQTSIFGFVSSASSPVSDVTVTATVTGAFNFVSVVAFSSALTCTNAPVLGGVTVTCHADQFPPSHNARFEIRIVPTTVGGVID